MAVALDVLPRLDGFDVVLDQPALGAGGIGNALTTSNAVMRRSIWSVWCLISASINRATLVAMVILDMLGSFLGCAD